MNDAEEYWPHGRCRICDATKVYRTGGASISGDGPTGGHFMADVYCCQGCGFLYLFGRGATMDLDKLRLAPHDGVTLGAAEVGRKHAELAAALSSLVDRRRAQNTGEGVEPKVATLLADLSDDGQAVALTAVGELRHDDGPAVNHPAVGGADRAPEILLSGGVEPEVQVQLEGELFSGLVHESSKLPDPTTPAIETIRSDDRMSSDA